VGQFKPPNWASSEYRNQKVAQILSGIVLVALLLTTSVAWHIAFSQQPPAGPNPDPDFTIVALPDTQYYTDEIRGAKIGMFTAQTQWVADNKTTENIKAVIGLGLPHPG
jgi:hypothetical protein